MKRHWLWLMVWMIACGGPKAPVATPVGTGEVSDVPASPVVSAEGAPGFVFKLRETKSSAEQPTRERTVQGKPLSEREAAALWKGVPPPATAPADTTTFAKREGSPPPPTAAELVKEPFPPAQVADGPDKAASGPLEVVRISPEGDVGLVRELSVTFNQPMVALTSHDESVAKGVPVALSPMPKGHFRWVGTRTLLFTAEPRFPLSSEFTVTIPKGTRSTSGNQLAKEQSSRFRTAELAIVDALPTSEGAKSGLLPLVFLAFNQRVRPEAVLSALELKAKGERYGLRLATDQEIAADRELKGKVDQITGEGIRDHAVVLRPERPLPESTRVELTVPKGTAAGEGPRGTAKAFTRTFDTHGALKLVKTDCGGEGICRPGGGVAVLFSTTLDWERFEPSWVRIEPKVELEIYPSGESLQVNARTLPRTKYTLFLSANVRDIFGQTLGSEQKATFEVGDALPELSSTPPIVMLDPKAQPRALHVESVNVDELSIEVRRVSPGDYVAYAASRERRGENQVPVLPGKVVWTQTVSLRERKNERVDTAIDLAPALSAGLGHAIVRVEPKPKRGKEFWLEPVLTWVQATEIGLDAFWDRDELVAWTTSLADGKAQSDVKLTLDGVAQPSTSNAEGVARMPLARGESSKVRVLMAQKGNDTALLPEHPWGAHGGGNWTEQPSPTMVRFHVFDDRGVYRPGETLRAKGWIRLAKPQNHRLPELPRGEIDALSYELTDSRGAAIARGSLKLNDTGGFDLTVPLPKTANLGTAQLRLAAQGKGRGEADMHWHHFQIEEYRRPEYEVAVRTLEATHFVGRPIKLEAKATYHAGGPLPEAKTTWTVRAEKGQFTPPGRDSYTFGEPPLWWDVMPMARGKGMHWPRGPVSEPVTLVGRTDSQGLHTLEILPESAEPAFVHQLSVSATVEDLNRQGFADHATLLVHPAEVYVGLRTARAFSSEKEALDVEAIVTDLDGKAAAERPFTVTLVELGGKFEGGEWKSTETEIEQCKLESASEASHCTLHPPRGGSYRIAARVHDARGKHNDTYLRHWVSGDAPVWGPAGQAPQVELVSDKQSYAPGETAKILLRAPFAPADVLVRVMHEDLVELKHFHITSKTHAFEIPLSEKHLPNLQVHADVVGRSTSPGAASEHPAFATGMASLKVSLEHLRLAVEAKAEQSTLEPGASTHVTLSVRDAKGEAVKGADVALVIVDEAILQLLDRPVQDPLASMVPDVGSYEGSVHAREWVLAQRQAVDVVEQRAAGGAVAMDKAMAMPNAPPMAEAAHGRMMAMTVANGAGAASAPIKLRSMFDPLALFAASLRTDDKGNASAKVDMPDTLTRYRVLAVAARGDQNFGFGESAITVQKALMLRPAAPRFVNLGDKLSLPVLVQNSSDAAMEIDLAIRGSNIVLAETRALRVSVPAHDRVEVRFQGAADKPGTVRLQFTAASGKLRDATELSLPAWTPVTDEAFATYGDMERDGAIAYALSVPKNVAVAFGGLEVTLSSTQLAALTDAVLSTLESRYDIPEQRASRILAALSVRDVLAAFGVQGIPDAAALNALVVNEIKELARVQHEDGGFGFYGIARESEPYVSVHVSHALARAHAAKIEVPEGLSSRLRDYVRSMPGRSKKERDKPTEAAELAYGAYTELAWGSADTKLAGSARERASKSKLSSEALGWLLPVFHARGDKATVQELGRTLLNRVSETAGAAEITTDEKDGPHLLLASSKRANAIVLEALVRTELSPDLAPKLARGLLAQRTRGKWEGTQENVFAVLALRAYFDVFEKSVPRFTARAFVAKTLAANARFEGRSTKQSVTHVPMRFLAAEKPGQLTLEKRGEGRLYYRLGLSYAPENYVLTPRDHGFVVERTYEAVDAPEDVRRDADGVWRVRAGARVKVLLTLVAPSRRHHVALVDPLPAGFEPINPALAVSEPLPDQGDQGGPIRPLMRMIWPGPWFGHENLRDERVEAHAAELEAGVYSYAYYARATTPGNFIAPPVRAEEIYAPETFGRGETSRVVVE